MLPSAIAYQCIHIYLKIYHKQILITNTCYNIQTNHSTTVKELSDLFVLKTAQNVFMNKHK